jgi:hypothetical protein
MEIIEWKPNERTLIQTWHKKLVQQKFIHTIIGKNTNNNSYPQDCSKFQKVEQCQCKHDKSGNQTPGNVMYG